MVIPPLLNKRSKNILVWNVRGLNDATRVRHLVSTERVSLLCLQETKMASINDYTLMQIVGAGFDYTYLPAARTRGGILVEWKSFIWSFTNISLHTYSRSGRVMKRKLPSLLNFTI